MKENQVKVKNFFEFFGPGQIPTPRPLRDPFCGFAASNIILQEKPCYICEVFFSSARRRTRTGCRPKNRDNAAVRKKDRKYSKSFY
jgi:hypothetical protein